MKKLLAFALLFVFAVAVPSESYAQPRRLKPRVQQDDYEATIKKLKADIAILKARLSRARAAKKHAEIAQLENQIAVLEARLSVHMRVAPPGRAYGHSKRPPFGMRGPNQIVSLNAGYNNGLSVSGQIMWPNMLTGLGLHKITGAASKGLSIGINYASVNQPAGTMTSLTSVYANISDIWVMSPSQIVYLSGGVNFPFSVTNNDTGKIGGQILLGSAWAIGAGGWISTDIGYVILRSNTVSSKSVYAGLGYHYGF